MPSGNGVGVSVSFAGAIVIENAAEAVLPAESVAVTLIVNAPSFVGVPVMSPLSAIVNPAGSPVPEYLTGDCPPVAAIVVL